MPKAHEENKEIAVKDTQQMIVKPAGSTQDMAGAIQAYREMQETLDKAMPDCIQEIQGKKFRKKNYWRAVKTAFNLSVFCIKEEKIEETQDWGYIVTYRSTAPNGASADGDGACTFKEKNKGNMAATLHNIRSQAHTRAFNRAVSNLVGFGEVSAEEVYHEEKTHIQPPAALKPPQKQTEMPLESKNTAQGMVQAMEVKKGEKDGRKWTLYIITVDDVKYSTFDKKLAEIATNAHKTQKSIIAEYAETEKGRNLVSLTMEAEEAHESKCNQCVEYARCEREAAIDCPFYLPLEETKPKAF